MERTATATALADVSHGHIAPAETMPYVVSLDIVPLLTRWSIGKGFKLPKAPFFAELRSDMQRELSTIFPELIIIEERDIRSQIVRTTHALGLPVISMDYTYCPVGVPLNVTRAVHGDMSDAGITHRGVSCSLDQQVRELAAQLKGDVALVDDVIFSGEMIARDVIPALRRHGITVRAVVAGIGIGGGIARIRDEVEDVRAVRTFPHVVDEICERDFYPGVPLSGRTVLGSENTGMPYIRPFGDPGKWASIPAEHIVEFSAFCVRQTASLFEAIEKASGKTVRMCDLPRGVHSLPSGDQRFVDELRKALSRI